MCKAVLHNKTELLKANSDPAGIIKNKNNTKSYDSAHNQGIALLANLYSAYE